MLSAPLHYRIHIGAIARRCSARKSLCATFADLCCRRHLSAASDALAAPFLRSARTKRARCLYEAARARGFAGGDRSACACALAFLLVRDLCARCSCTNRTSRRRARSRTHVQEAFALSLACASNVRIHIHLTGLRWGRYVYLFVVAAGSQRHDPAS